MAGGRAHLETDSDSDATPLARRRPAAASSGAAPPDVSGKGIGGFVATDDYRPLTLPEQRPSIIVVCGSQMHLI